ncbi:MAG: hypothetical protein ICV79_13215, partial [Flavisolibacter sp.]|nr:hypothetical protein [Flavisolibacter sp.]
MQPLTKRVILIIVFSLAASVQGIHAQDSRYDYNYDSLARQLDKTQTDTERIKLLTLLVDLAPEVGVSFPTEKTIAYLMRL